MTNTEKGFFKYDEKNDREWFEIELNREFPYSRAAIQDYASRMGVTPRTWVLDAIVWFMHECDRQGAHGSSAPTRERTERKSVPAWRVRIAERLYEAADELSGIAHADEDENGIG